MTMTDQQVFDKVWERAKDARRTAPGFLGCLVPEDERTAAHEGMTAHRIARRVPALRNVDPWLLDAIDGVYCMSEPAHWRVQLMHVAASYGLAVPR